MNLSILLVVVAAAAVPRVEISTLSGDEFSGNLTSITADTWKLDVDGKPVEVAGAQILATRFFVAGQTAGEKESLELSLTDGSLLHLKTALADPKEIHVTSDVTGDMKLPEGVEMIMPGDNAKVEIELIQPVAIEEGSKFAIREGGMTVGAGVVTKIIG